MSREGSGNFIVGVLFGGGFAAVGFGILWFLIIPILTEGFAASGWVPVEAMVESTHLEPHRSKDSTSYEVSARYRYRYQGVDYTGDRVGLYTGADNLGSWHQDWYHRLHGAQVDGRPITVYVNPEKPFEALIDRDIRWHALGFMFIFPVAFGSIGLGVLYFSLKGARKGLHMRERPVAGSAARPSTPVQRGVEVVSNATAGVIGLWLFATFWNAIGVPASVLALGQELPKGNYPVLAILIFPLAGLGLVVFAILKTLEWRRFGKVALVMDPYPGAIGGEMAGSIDIPVPHLPGHRYQATLACVRSYYSGSGKNRSRREEVLWQEEGVPQGGSSAAGTRLFVRFKIPAGLPASEEPAGSYHFWRLHLEGDMPGVDLSRSFEVPMQPGTAATGMFTDRSFTPENGPPPELPPSTVRVSRDAHGTLFMFPSGRMKGASILLLAFGSIFLAVPLLAGDQMPLLPRGLFGLVAVTILLVGLWLPFNSLLVRAGPREIESERRWAGIPLFRHGAPKPMLARLQRIKGMSSSSGGKTTIYYRLQLHTRDGRRITVAENLKGSRLARELGREMAERFGVPFEE